MKTRPIFPILVAASLSLALSCPPAGATGNAQGRLLQGTPIDGFWLDPAAARMGETAHRLDLDRGTLVATPPLPASWTAPLVVPGPGPSGPIVVEISDPRPHDYIAWQAEAPVPVPGTADYRVRYRRADSSMWQDLCVSGARAIAVGGTWSPDGHHTVDATRFTFACADGVIAKCIDWGYAPWPSPSGARMAPYHQACTRMARADYCYDGKSRTVAGTIIDYSDAATPPLNAAMAADDLRGADFSAEAVWRDDVPAERLPGRFRPAVCLYKKRWATLPLGGPCGVYLTDPRIRPKHADACDDRSEDFWRTHGGLLFNRSTIIDAALSRWQRTPADTVTGVKVPARVQKRVDEGAVYAATVAAALRPSGATELLQIFRSRRNGELLTATSTWSSSSLPAGYAAQEPAGWIFPAATPEAARPRTAQPLYLFQCGKDWVTTTGAAPSPSCGPATLLGYLPIGAR